MGIVMTTKLIESNLTANQLRVAFWLPMISKPGNIVIVTGKMAELRLNIERHYFSRIMTELVKRDIVKRLEARGSFMINPAFAWNGSAADHHYARDAWYKDDINKHRFMPARVG